MKNKSLILLSGGLDSAVTLVLAVKNKQNPLALTFDYGQKAVRREVAASRRLAAFYGVPHRVIKIDWLAGLSDSALLNKKFPPPPVTEKSLELAASRKNSLKVWVPNRNGLFINLAAALAEALQIPVIYAGFNKEEAQNFPDNSADFIKAANWALKFSTLSRVKIKSYLINLDKTGILKKALELKVPLPYIWVCYQGGRNFCGKCESCQRFKRAVKNVAFGSSLTAVSGGIKSRGPRADNY